MERKNVVFLTILAVATLLTAVVGATFAYFSLTVGGNHENVTTTVKTAVVTGLNFDGNSVASAPEGGAYPGWKGVQKFTLSLPTETASEAKGGKYTVTLTPNIPSELEGYVKYTVYKVTNPSEADKITVSVGEKNLNDGQISVTSTVTEDGQYKDAGSKLSSHTNEELTGSSPIIIDSGTYDGTFQKTEYYILYEFTNESSDQNAAMGKTFTAKVDVKVELDGVD